MKLLNLQLQTLMSSELKDYAETLSLWKENSASLFEQAMAYISSKYRFIPDAKEFLEVNCSTPWDRGLYVLLNNTDRSKLMKGILSTPANLPYSTLVPIYMAAFKKYNNVPYSAWKNPGPILPKALRPVLDIAAEDVPDRETLVNMRVLACGDREPQKAYNLGHVKVLQAPKIVNLILLQLWLAAPEVRHEYMLLDPFNFDNMPEPLIAPEPIKVMRNPWDY